MNDADVSRQIQQMVRFILQEAEEKANEISVSAEEVFIFYFGWNLQFPAKYMISCVELGDRDDVFAYKVDHMMALV